MSDNVKVPDPYEPQKVKVGKNVIELDPNRLIFNEASLNKWLQESHAWYNYYAQLQADADAWLQTSKMQYDIKYAGKFRNFKEMGGSDKLAEANTKADPEVEEAKKYVIVADRTVMKLKLYLRSFDQAFRNAENFGHNIRKELDKLLSTATGERCCSGLDKKIEEIVGGSQG